MGPKKDKAPDAPPPPEDKKDADKDKKETESTTKVEKKKSKAKIDKPDADKDAKAKDDKAKDADKDKDKAKDAAAGDDKKPKARKSKSQKVAPEGGAAADPAKTKKQTDEEALAADPNGPAAAKTKLAEGAVPAAVGEEDHGTQLEKKVAALKALETEGYHAVFYLEEAEVLPYEDNVFEWDIIDPIGYYREDAKFNRLITKYKNDDMKRIVVEGMWRDRIKYQVLRRFEWPPPLLCKQIFFTRGYYEDSDIRPTVNIENLHLMADRKRLFEETKLREANEHRDLLHDQAVIEHAPKPEEKKHPPKAAPAPVVTGQKRSLSDFDPEIYNREILEIKGLHKDTTKAELEKMFPKAIVTLKPDDKGGVMAVMEFQNFGDSRAAFAKALKSKIRDHPLHNILPQMRVLGGSGRGSRGDVVYANPYMVKSKLPQSDVGKAPKPKTSKNLTDYDPNIYDYQHLIIKGIPGDTNKEMIKKQFEPLKIKVEHLDIDPTNGRLIATIRLKSDEDAIKAYKDNHEQFINHGEMDIVPAKRDLNKPKKEKKQDTPEYEMVEEVTYEVVKKKKDKKDKKKKK